MTAAGAPTHPDSSESFATSNRYAWVLHPWVHRTPLAESLPQQECWPAMICDLSPECVSLVLRRGFPTGEVVELQLHSQACGCVRWLPATVVNVQSLDTQGHGGRWRLLCNFSEPLTPDELQALQAAGSRP